MPRSRIRDPLLTLLEAQQEDGRGKRKPVRGHFAGVTAPGLSAGGGGASIQQLISTIKDPKSIFTPKGLLGQQAGGLLQSAFTDLPALATGRLGGGEAGLNLLKNLSGFGTPVAPRTNTLDTLSNVFGGDTTEALRASDTKFDIPEFIKSLVPGDAEAAVDAGEGINAVTEALLADAGTVGSGLFNTSNAPVAEALSTPAAEALAPAAEALAPAGEAAAAVLGTSGAPPAAAAAGSGGFAAFDVVSLLIALAISQSQNQAPEPQQ